MAFLLSVQCLYYLAGVAKVPSNCWGGFVFKEEIQSGAGCLVVIATWPRKFGYSLDRFWKAVYRWGKKADGVWFLLERRSNLLSWESTCNVRRSSRGLKENGLKINYRKFVFNYYFFCKGACGRSRLSRKFYFNCGERQEQQRQSDNTNNMVKYTIYLFLAVFFVFKRP